MIIFFCLLWTPADTSAAIVFKNWEYHRSKVCCHQPRRRRWGQKPTRPVSQRSHINTKPNRSRKNVNTYRSVPRTCGLQGQNLIKVPLIIQMLRRDFNVKIAVINLYFLCFTFPSCVLEPKHYKQTVSVTSSSIYHLLAALRELFCVLLMCRWSTVINLVHYVKVILV